MLHASKSRSGFTIIELMIATTILAVILLVVTAMAVNIGNLFYKDVNQASIQDNVRAITDELTQHLQLMGTTGLQQTPPTATTAGAICIDSTRYSYVIGKQISPNPANPPGDQTVHVLWRDTWTGGGCPPVTNLTTAASPSSSGTELIAPNSRLTAFCVGSYTPSTNSCTPPAAGSTTFTVTVGGAYGDGDLLSTTTGTTAQCKGQVGDRFCATAYLSTTVDQRLVTGATPPGGGGGPSCDNTADAYAKANTTVYFATDDNGSAPFYTTSDQKGPENPSGNHGTVLTNVSNGQYQTLGSPVICIGDVPPGGFYSGPSWPPPQADLVGRTCDIYLSLNGNVMTDTYFEYDPFDPSSNTMNTIGIVDSNYRCSGKDGSYMHTPYNTGEASNGGGIQYGPLGVYSIGELGDTTPGLQFSNYFPLFKAVPNFPGNTYFQNYLISCPGGATDSTCITAMKANPNPYIGN